ncbi:MAG: hypothetical protein WB609_06190 [Candidatus Cybelea sp.]
MAKSRVFLGIDKLHYGIHNLFYHEDAYRRALDAIGLKRRHPKMSFTKAAKLSGTTIKTVRKYAASAIEVRSGRIDVTRSDRLKRRMRMLTDKGEIAIPTTSSQTASRISRYNNAVREFYATGKTTALKPFVGKAVRSGGKRYEFVTNPAALNRLGRAGSVHFSEIYAPESES